MGEVPVLGELSLYQPSWTSVPAASQAGGSSSPISHMPATDLWFLFLFQTFMNEAAKGKTSNSSQICVHTLILMNQNPSRGLLSRGQRDATLAYWGSYHLPEHVPSSQFSSLVYMFCFFQTLSCITVLQRHGRSPQENYMKHVSSGWRSHSILLSAACDFYNLCPFHKGRHNSGRSGRSPTVPPSGIKQTRTTNIWVSSLPNEPQEKDSVLQIYLFGSVKINK